MFVWQRVECGGASARGGPSARGGAAARGRPSACPGSRSAPARPSASGGELRQDHGERGRVLGDGGGAPLGRERRRIGT